MNEQQIRNLIRQEIFKANNGSRFNGVTSVVDHVHNGVDAPKILADNVVPSLNTAGAITFGTQGATYTINLNSSFTPSNILAYGVVTDSASSPSVRCHTIGSAQLTKGFYLQSESSRSVKMGGPEYPFPTEQPDGTSKVVPIQGSSFIYVTNGGTVRAGVSEDHIVDIFIGSAISDIRARVTIVEFSKTAIKLYVPYLTSGWRVNVNYVIS